MSENTTEKTINSSTNKADTYVGYKKEKEKAELAEEKAVLATNTIAEKDLELLEKEKEINGFNEKFEKMEKMMAELMKSQNQAPQQAPVQQMVLSTEEEEIYIDSCFLKRVFLIVEKGRDIEIQPGKAEPFLKEDARKLVQNRRYKPLFEKGLLFFEDKKWYKHFRISLKSPLTEEYVNELMSLDKSGMIQAFNRITEDRKNSAFYSVLRMKCAKVFKSGEASKEAQINQTHVDEYFKGYLQLTMKQLDWDL